jgi:hypothetical protein
MCEADGIRKLDGDPNRRSWHWIIATPFIISAADLVIKDVEGILAPFEIGFDTGIDGNPIPTWVRGGARRIDAIVFRVSEVAAQQRSCLGA